MPRRRRVCTGGIAFHVLNRAVGRAKLFRKAADYAAFQRVLESVDERLPMRVACYCLMPNHWHLILWPREDGQLSEFLRLADRHPHPTLARPLPLGGHGAAVPGAL